MGGRQHVAPVDEAAAAAVFLLRQNGVDVIIFTQNTFRMAI
jgi:hypothetical protein